MNNPTQPQFNPKELLQLYFNQKYDDLSIKFLEILIHFDENTYFQLGADSQYFIDAFVKNFLYFFTQSDYIISDQYTVKFIQLNPTIANVVAMSSFKSTDAHLEILRTQPNNFVKILALYSARNTVEFERKVFFDANADLACVWYSHYIELYKSALVNRTAYQNLRQHILYTDDRLNTFYSISEICFGSTYINNERDKEIKFRLNKCIQESPFCQTANIQNTPHPKKIAIITALWFSQHSVYRNFSELVNSLIPEYELTLIHLGGVRNNLDIQGFKGIKYIFSENGVLNIDAIRENDFQAVFFPDVGMSTESIFLSNLRIAPIQISGVGHSVSTFGSKVDYYMSGQDVENAQLAEQNYSERLVLMPGFGVIHNHPTYQIKNPQKTDDRFVINCSWFAQKVNYQMLLNLRKILAKSQKKLLFRFFAGGALIRKNDFIPFEKDLEAILGKEHFELVPVKPYNEYMEMMELGDLSIESYHFGGCNIVADTLYLRQVIVTFEGTKWNNRIGSQMLRAINLDELITNNAED
ncbi:MAG TPA: hypothetical protein V6C58_04235, partial [Allocoleopsis sp.]